MKKIELSEEEKKEFIDYMLRNEELEKTIRDRDKALPRYEIAVLSSILSRCKDNAGLIVAVNNSEIPVGADNIELYTELTEFGKMRYAETEDGTKYVMVFTSKSRL